MVQLPRREESSTEFALPAADAPAGAVRHPVAQLKRLDLWNLFCDAVVDLEIHGVHYSVPSNHEREAIGTLMDTLTEAWAAFEDAEDAK